MFPLTFKQLASVVGGQIVRGPQHQLIRGVVYRRAEHLQSGMICFLEPKRFGSASFLKHKKSSGVVAPLGGERWIPRHHPLITVPNVTEALWRLVRWQREQSRATVVAITGSSGKTTTKEMLASIAKQKYPTLKTLYNRNLLRSLPSHLFRLNGLHRVVVLEVSPPHLRVHCQYAQPLIGIITNIGEAHIGNFGSLNNLVRSKQQLILGIQPGGTLIINADDPGSKQLNLNLFHGNIIRIGIDQPANLRATHIRFTTKGMQFRVDGIPYFIPTWGKHHVYNALAAIAAARKLGIPTTLIQRGLSRYAVPPGRLQPLPGIHGSTLIHDAYNANPTAMIAGLKVLKHIAGSRPSIAVLGNMLELGPYTASGHQKVGHTVAKLGISRLITVGSHARAIAQAAVMKGLPPKRIRSFPNLQAAASSLPKMIVPGSVVYFKASRNIHLDRLVFQLQKKKSGSHR
ncbi:UDP-N-acetylmuramoyl-tripeptide--D-alanyl-D-alanine ligase [Polycladomyces subterraneus]|uniref:UDP-N-acetylmuramoyl-tripeptide--D-alanyl-D-alanine ligase n=1 Tax=Polycladomyces subterraneus TaxID=1016997 RepID=A0ABT8IID7_9BACL|nr:UDP-N-acetylmuramoyl-tripeptide--D-alanyl-D-alanine ligase [Polycladomyces subterraneus]MDN4592553.1 UDP-N-acetylmuramoyl-tripeptide--D-alanyl-D-alanine ligase [Polycladomyces subterraneus]